MGEEGAVEVGGVEELALEVSRQLSVGLVRWGRGTLYWNEFASDQVR